MISQHRTPAGRPGAVLALVCVAQFMVLLDVSVVNVALPSIGSDLHYRATSLQWVVNAYTVAFAGCLLFGGRLADVLGQRRTFLIGLALFGGASLVGGLAQTSIELTTARAVQGIGGAVLSPATLTIVTGTFAAGRPRQQALAIWNAVGGAGGALGGIAGGVITDVLGWRWVLMINLPIAVLAAAATAVVSLPGSSRSGQRADPISAIAATAGLAGLTYALIGVSDHGWASARTGLAAVIGIGLLAGFLARQRRLGDDALLPLGMLANRRLSSANAVMLLAGATFFSMWYFLSLYFQQVLGYGPLGTGLLFLPMGAGIIAGSVLSARLVAAKGVRAVSIAGMVLAAAGFGLLTTVSADRSSAILATLGGVAAAAGVGVSFPPLTAAATAAGGLGRDGLVSGLLNTARQLGGSVGLAVLTTVAASGGRAVAGPARQADGIGLAFTVAAGLAVAAGAVALLLPGPATQPEAAHPEDHPSADGYVDVVEECS